MTAFKRKQACSPNRSPACEQAARSGQSPAGLLMLCEFERSLVERLRSCDPAALSTLIDTYGGRVYQLALRISNNHHDAEEIVQDVCLAIHRKIGSFRGDSALSSWISRITVNMACSRHRGTRRNLVEIPLDKIPSGWSHTAEELLLGREARQQIDRAIAELPVMYGTVVDLRDIEGFSSEEVASIVGAGVGAVKSRLHRGRLALREKLEAYFNRKQMRSPGDRGFRRRTKAIDHWAHLAARDDCGGAHGKTLAGIGGMMPSGMGRLSPPKMTAFGDLGAGRAGGPLSSTLSRPPDS